MGIILSLVALSIAFLGGFGVVLLLSAGKPRPDLCGICGSALICGAGLVALSSFWLGFLLHGPWLRCAVVGICLAPPLYVWKRNQWAWPELRLPPVTAPQVTLLALPAILLGFVTWFSLYRETLEWDGLFNWESRARVAFLSHGSIPLGFYTSAYDFFHRTYPPLVPILEAWIYGFVGRLDESMAKLIGPYFYLAAALLLISVARRAKNHCWSATLVVLPFLLVPSLLMGAGSAASGYADFPLSAIYLCAVVHLIEHWRTGSLASARLAGVSAMLLPFTKTDGVILLLCIAAAIAPLVVRGLDWEVGAWVVLPGLSLLIVWRMFLTVLGVPPETDFAAFTPAVFLSNVDRARPLLSWTLQEFGAWRNWSLLWPLAAAALVFLFVGARRFEWYPWAAVVLLPLFIYPNIYFFSAWDPVEPHVKSSLPRLFIHIAAAAALMVGLVFAEMMDAGVILLRKREENLPSERSLKQHREIRSALSARVVAVIAGAFLLGFVAGYAFRGAGPRSAQPPNAGPPPKLAIAAGQAVVGYLDQVSGHPVISVTDGGQVGLSGWAACSNAASPLANLEVLVDGQAKANAVTSFARPDVAAAFDRPDFEHSGWKASFAAQGLNSGTHSITARVTCAGGETGILPPFRLVVKDK